jgi:hypothetical protein
VLGRGAVSEDEPENHLVVHVLMVDEQSRALVERYGLMVRLDPLLVPASSAGED